MHPSPFAVEIVGAGKNGMSEYPHKIAFLFVDSFSRPLDIIRIATDNLHCVCSSLNNS